MSQAWPALTGALIQALYTLHPHRASCLRRAGTCARYCYLPAPHILQDHPVPAGAGHTRHCYLAAPHIPRFAPFPQELAMPAIATLQQRTPPDSSSLPYLSLLPYSTTHPSGSPRSRKSWPCLRSRPNSPKVSCKRAVWFAVYALCLRARWCLRPAALNRCKHCVLHLFNAYSNLLNPLRNLFSAQCF